MTPAEKKRIADGLAHQAKLLRAEKQRRAEHLRALAEQAKRDNDREKGK